MSGTLARVVELRFKFGPIQIRVTHATAGLLVADIAARLVQGLGFSLATINLDHLVKLRRDPRFRSAYARQDMVVADGNPIVWLSRVAGQPVDLVPGSDLVLPLATAAAAAGRPVAIIGTTDRALAAAVRELRTRVPGVDVAFTCSPAMGFDPEGAGARAILAEIAKLGPVLVFVALGAPRQERFAALGRQLVPQAGYANIGAGVDFLAGAQRRAPIWVRRLALEWMWRLLTSPRRMTPRYAACLAILPVQALDALRQRMGI